MLAELKKVLFPYFSPGELQNRTALVTGGSRGIGRAVSLGLSLLGANLLVCYLQDQESADSLREEIEQIGGHCRLFQGDVASKATLVDLAEEALSHFGGIDILVNNAALLRDKLFLFMKEADWDRVLEVNLKAVYYGCQAVLKPMIGQHFGRIINLASPSALLGLAGQTNYAASKGGVISFTKSLAREVAHLGITVNAVSPGLIETDLLNHLDKKIRDKLIRQIPGGQPGNPLDVVGTMLFLASRRSDYITGQIIAVDGGLT